MREELKRRYDLGNGIEAVDNGYWIQLKIPRGEKSALYTGCVRLPEIGETEKVTESLDGKVFYCDRWALLNGASGGFWFSSEKYQTKDACEAAMSPGVFGKPTAWFKDKDGDEYYRGVYHFNCWKIKESESRDVEWSEAIKDYCALIMAEHEKHVAELDNQLAGTGWTYAKLVEKIGPWVSPEEIPVVKLEVA